MSDAVSALNGASFTGLVRIEDVGLQGMITLRGDLGARAVKSAATGGSGAAMPGQRQITFSDDGALGWMSPDEFLVLCPHAQVAARLEKMTRALGKTHALAVDVSDARAMFRLTGPATREVIAKLCPVDMSPDAFKPGQLARTRMAQVPAAIWMSDAETAHVVCFRSVADYVFGVLCAAAQPGSDVGYF